MKLESYQVRRQKLEIRKIGAFAFLFPFTIDRLPNKKDEIRN
jgi:hypothetical protein